MEVSSAEFHAAEADGFLQRCDKDRRKGYLRDDLVVWKDAQTGHLRYRLRDTPEHDRYAIPSWLGRMIKRHAIYTGAPNSDLYRLMDHLYAIGVLV